MQTCSLERFNLFDEDNFRKESSVNTRFRAPLDQWPFWSNNGLVFSRAGKPTDNAFIESFNGDVRR
jgi:transposase InsO family protein